MFSDKVLWVFLNKAKMWHKNSNSKNHVRENISVVERGGWHTWAMSLPLHINGVKEPYNIRKHQCVLSFQCPQDMIDLIMEGEARGWAESRDMSSCCAQDMFNFIEEGGGADIKTKIGGKEERKLREQESRGKDPRALYKGRIWGDRQGCNRRIAAAEVGFVHRCGHATGKMRIFYFDRSTYILLIKLRFFIARVRYAETSIFFPN